MINLKVNGEHDRLLNMVSVHLKSLGRRNEPSV